MVSTGAVLLAPPYTAARVASGIDDLLVKFGFSGDYKISATTDSGANIVSAVQLCLKHNWLKSLNNMMHYAVHDVLKLSQVFLVTTRAQEICVLIRKSPPKWETFK